MSLNETAELVKAAQMNPDAIAKAGTDVALGLVNYDLQAPAINLYPWGEKITPIRAALPRVISQNGDTATRWKAITAINSTNVHPGLSEGQRGGEITQTLDNKTAAYVSLGIENSVTFEADAAAQGFQDVKAQAVEAALRSLMIQEEKMLFGGNSSVALGTTPTPTVGLVAGGSITAGTYKVICVALTHDGYLRAGVNATGVVQQISRTNADGTTDTINAGAAQKSAASADVTTASTNLSISASVTAVNGAVAYAWYVGAAGSEKIAAITTINSVVLTALPSSGNQAASALTSNDRSAESGYSFDGLLYATAFGSSTGAYLNTLATGTAGTGTTLTTDSAGGVAEIETALQSFYDNYRVSPDTIWCNSAQLKKITSLVIGGGGAPLFRFNSDAKATGGISGGAQVGSYLNKITQDLIQVKVHPFCPPGTILFTSSSIPYPLSGVGAVAQVKLRQRDYYQIEYPLTSRKYQFGVYAGNGEVLQVFAPFAFGAITNIA
jgi:hypothetical protein